MTAGHLSVVSAALTASCVIPYLHDIRRGTTKPQRATWFVFATVSIVACASQLAAGASSGVWLSAGAAIGFTAVFIASIRHGVGGVATSDRIMLAIAFTGIIVSVAARQALIAVVSVVVAEIVAIALTIHKSYHDPGSETRSTWVIDCIAGALAILAVDELSTTDALYPIHHTIVNGLVIIAITTGSIRGRLGPASPLEAIAKSDRPRPG